MCDDLDYLPECRTMASTAAAPMRVASKWPRWQYLRGYDHARQEMMLKNATVQACPSTQNTSGMFGSKGCLAVQGVWQ